MKTVSAMILAMSMLVGCVSNGTYTSGGGSYNGGTSQTVSQTQSGEINPGEKVGQESQEGTNVDGSDAGFGAISG